MGKVSVSNFRESVCVGCPNRKLTDEDTEGFTGKAAKAEGSVLEALSGEKQYKCGLCGCPLANLELFDQAPEDCPRLVQHNQ